jgi:mono/diheme cytochrome c family protein
MKNSPNPGAWFPIFTLLTLVLSGCAVQTTVLLKSEQMTATVEARMTLPLVAPSIEEGKNRFTQYCSSCHIQSNPAQTSDTGKVDLIPVDWLKQTLPTQMYSTLTSGITAHGMPAFPALSSSDRWNLVAYLLSLVATQGSQSNSKLIYQNMCLSCHGSTGNGDGSQAISKNLQLSDWQSEPLLMDYSNEELYYAIRSGNNHGMGTFAVMLSDAQIWSLVATTRALSVSPSNSNTLLQNESGQPASTTASQQNQGFITIEGTVTNGSGSTLDDLNGLNLEITRPGQTTQTMVAKVMQDNSFQFVLVPYSADWSYTAEITNNGIVYKSVRFSGQSTTSGSTVPLDIKVYDTSADTSVLRAERLHVLLDFQADHLIHVTESYLIRNPSSYTVSPVDEQTPLLNFLLNKDAQNVIVDQNSQSQFLKVLTGKLGDWQPILPGGVHQVMFEYDLPFENDRNILFNVPVQVTSAMIMVENQGKEITCSGMLTSNQQMAKSESLLMFTGGNVDAGGNLELHCFNKNEIFPEIIGIIALVLALMCAIWIGFATKKKGAQQQGNGSKKTTLLDAVIALDDQFKAGEISAEVYHAKREELIKKLGGE